MSVSPSVHLAESRRIEDFLPVMREVEFGDRFLLSMLHWCGFGARSSPLDFWQVFLIKSESETAGVSGLYRPPASSDGIFWIGWFGVRPKFRRQGIGRDALRLLRARAKMLDGRELWVYTGATDDAALRLYSSAGFERLGPGALHAPGLTIEPSDIVFRLQLSEPSAA